MSTLIKRYFFFILGLIINSFGVAFITKSTLGTSQISSIPYVLSLKFTNLSFGQTVAFRTKCKIFSRHLQNSILKTEKGRFKGL